MLQKYFKTVELPQVVTALIYLIAFLLPLALDITTGLIYGTVLVAIYDRFKNKRIYS